MDARSCVLTLLSVLRGAALFLQPLLFSVFMDVKG